MLQRLSEASGHPACARSNLRHFLLISTSLLNPSTCHTITHDVPSVSTPYKRCMSRAFTPFTPSVTELPHLAILSGSTTPFVRHEFSTRSSLSSTIHCASLASLFIPLPLPFFPFSSFSRRNNEMWKNGSSLLKSEHRPRSLLCLLFPFRPRGRRKMASGEYTLTGMEISLPLSSFSFLP